MRVVIAGSRKINYYPLVVQAVKQSGFTISDVVSGACRGVDKLGEKWAQEHRVRLVQFHANWKELGQAAGPKRSEQMADYADALILVWDGASTGSKDILEMFKERKKPRFVLKVTD